MSIPAEYIIAEGPEGLKKILAEFLEKSRNDPIFAKQKHHVLYQLGSQKSMIRIDTDRTPFKFWYYDLMGRAATVAVKDVLADFLWDNWGEKQE
ncbi:MAG: hypothetical protein ABI597_09180 [Gammaproteobacteria bacterium]